MKIEKKDFAEIVWDCYLEHNGKVDGIIVHPSTWSIICKEEKSLYFKSKLIGCRRSKGWIYDCPKKFINIPIYESSDIEEDEIKLVLKSEKFEI